MELTFEAQVEDGSARIWVTWWSRDAPLSECVKIWAAIFGVPAEVVGLARCGKTLDQSKSPQELGWEGLEKATVFTFPLDDSFAEQSSSPAITKTIDLTIDEAS